MGLARNMMYSLIQQVIHFDPGYYSMHVAAHPIHQWHLISYPYAATQAVSGEHTKRTTLLGEAVYHIVNKSHCWSAGSESNNKFLCDVTVYLVRRWEYFRDYIAHS
jgi:hypothetical protein